MRLDFIEQKNAAPPLLVAKNPARVILAGRSLGDPDLLTRACEKAGFHVGLKTIRDRASLAEALLADGWEAIVADADDAVLKTEEVLKLRRRAGRGDDPPLIAVYSRIGEETIAYFRAGVFDLIRKNDMAGLADALGRAIRTGENRRAELGAFDRLAEKEHYYRTLWNQAPAAYHILDPDGIIRAVNQTECRLLGYSRREMIGRPIFDFIRADQRADARERFREKLAGKKIPRTKGRIYLTKKEKPIYVSVDDVLEYGPDGRVTGIRTTMHDITRLVMAEKGLHDNRLALLEAQHIAHLGNWDLDLKKNRLEWSAEIYNIFGLKPDEFKATYESFLGFVHPDDRDKVKKAVDRALYRREPYAIDHRVIRPDGTERIVHEQAKVYFDERLRPVRMIGTVQDITREKEAEKFIILRSAVLKLSGEATGRRGFLSGLAGHLRAWTGCRQVGIRILNEQDEIPYEAQIGFPAGFLRAENRLHAVNDRCACTRLASNRPTAPDQAALTPGGSFFLPRAQNFAARLTAGGKKLFRDGCFREGYETLAIIPIKDGARIMGVVHLADKRPARLSEKMIAHLEGIMPLVGEAVHKFDAREKLRVNYDIQSVLNDILRLALEDVPLKALLKRIIGRLLAVPWISFEAKGGIWLYDKNPDRLVLAAEYNLPPEVRVRCGQIKPGVCLCGRAARANNIQFTSRLDEKHEVKYSGMSDHGHYIVPIAAGGKILGIINFYLPVNHSYQPKEADFLVSVANVVAGIIGRKISQAELRRSQEKYRRLIDNAGEAVITLDQSGTITFANEMFFRMSGYDKTDVPGLHFSRLIHPDEKSDLKKRFSDRFSGQDQNLSASHDFKSVTKTNEVKYISYTTTPIYEGKKITGLQVIARDITQMKLLSRAVEQARDHFMKVIDAIEDAICVIDRQRCVVSTNKKFAAETGLSFTELRGRPFAEVIDHYGQGMFENGCADDCSGDNCLILRAFSEGRSFEFEREHGSPDGKPSHARIVIYPIRNNRGRIYQAVISISDISSRRQAEAEARRLHEFNQRLLDHVPLSIITIDKQGLITSANYYFRKLSKTGQYKNRRIRDFAFMRREGLVELYENIFATGQPFAKDGCSYVDHRGKTKYLNIIATPFYNETGQIEGAVSMALDNTETVTQKKRLESLNRILKRRIEDQKQADEQIRLLSEINQKIVDNSPSSIVMIDNRGIVLAANELAKSLMDKPGQPITGRRLADTREIKDNPELTNLFHRLLAEGKPFRYENLSYIKSATGEQRHLNIMAVPLFTARDNRPDGAISMAFDNTEAVKSKGLLENLNRELELKVRERTKQLDAINRRLSTMLDLKSKFVADASHELRTPLTVIQGYLELALKAREYSRPGEIKELYETIIDEVEKMKGILFSLTLLTNADSGQDQVRHESLDINQTAKSVYQSLKILADQKQIKLRICSERRPVMIMGDEPKLEKMLLNIVRNAIKYTPTGGEVSITAKNDEANREGLLIVADTGLGIPAEHLPFIFERFYRVDKARSREEGGSGLGLSIVKYIVDAHRGRIEAESAPGQGSKFTVHLPYDFKQAGVKASLF